MQSFINEIVAITKFPFPISIHLPPSKFHFPAKFQQIFQQRRWSIPSNGEEVSADKLRATDTINADPSNRRTRWTSITADMRPPYHTGQMLPSPAPEITRLISPRGSSTRNPSINVVSCESYYRLRPIIPPTRPPVVSLSLESTTISPLTVEIFRCRRGSSNLAERSRPRRRV